MIANQRTSTTEDGYEPHGCRGLLGYIKAFSLAHVRAQHPDNVDHVVADALAGEGSKPRFGFDCILTPDGYRSTCRTCGSTVTAEDPCVLDDWPAVHVRECPAADHPDGRPTSRRKDL